MNDIMRNPETVKSLAHEIKKVCDGYWSRQISEDNAKKYMTYWAVHEGKKLFKGKEFNSTLSMIIGKRRIDLISNWLEVTQIEF